MRMMQLIIELQPKKRGRPLILGKDLDDAIQKYILSIREADGIVNTAIVIAGARGILKSMNRTIWRPSIFKQGMG